MIVDQQSCTYNNLCSLTHTYMCEHTCLLISHPRPAAHLSTLHISCCGYWSAYHWWLTCLHVYLILDQVLPGRLAQDGLISLSISLSPNSFKKGWNDSTQPQSHVTAWSWWCKSTIKISKGSALMLDTLSYHMMNEDEILCTCVSKHVWLLMHVQQVLLQYLYLNTWWHFYVHHKLKLVWECTVHATGKAVADSLGSDLCRFYQLDTSNKTSIQNFVQSMAKDLPGQQIDLLVST